MELTSSPYKDEVIQKLASRGRGRGTTGNARGRGGAGLRDKGERRGVTGRSGARGVAVMDGEGDSNQRGNSIKEEGSYSTGCGCHGDRSKKAGR